MKSPKSKGWLGGSAAFAPGIKVTSMQDMRSENRVKNADTLQVLRFEDEVDTGASPSIFACELQTIFKHTITSLEIFFVDLYLHT